MEVREKMRDFRGTENHPTPTPGPRVAWDLAGQAALGWGVRLVPRSSLLQAPTCSGGGQEGGLLQQSPKLARAASPQLCRPRATQVRGDSGY